jgi:hypothetical protein
LSTLNLLWYFSTASTVIANPLFIHYMPLCAPFPGTLSVLVMNNARIYHGAEILERAECFSWCFPTIFLMLIDNCFYRDENQVFTALLT